MSTSALSKETLSYTYTTVPTFTNTMVGYSNSNNTLIASSVSTTAVNVLSITIAKPGVYLCEGNLGASWVASPSYFYCSLSTNSATENINSMVNLHVISSSVTFYTHITSVITISNANTTLYFVCRSVNVDASTQNGFIKYTRIA